MFTCSAIHRKDSEMKDHIKNLFEYFELKEYESN